LFAEETSESAGACDSTFLPVIPPQLHPAKGLLPPNWEDFPPDPKIPDVTEWNVKQVAEYFSQNGFSREQVDSFLEKVATMSVPCLTNCLSDIFSPLLRRSMANPFSFFTVMMSLEHSA
jgi:hypothetical protein